MVTDAPQAFFPYLLGFLAIGIAQSFTALALDGFKTGFNLEVGLSEDTAGEELVAHDRADAYIQDRVFAQGQVNSQDPVGGRVG